MKETKRDLLGQLAMNNQLGCVQCALEMGQEVPITFYEAFCEGCCKMGAPLKWTMGSGLFRQWAFMSRRKTLKP